MTYEQFKGVLKGNREQFEANDAKLQLTDAELTPFRELRSALDVVVVVTETCPDVIMNLPILNGIAQATGKLNPRIFLRDDNKDLMAQYMNGPYESVPVFAFFDQDWNELGVWIERPRGVTELREAKTREIYASDPAFGSPDGAASELPEDVRGRLQQAIRQMRSDTMDAYARETVRDLGEMIREMTAAPANGLPKRRGNLAAVAA
jgi:hypothetical protein